MKILLALVILLSTSVFASKQLPPLGCVELPNLKNPYLVIVLQENDVYKADLYKSGKLIASLNCNETRESFACYDETLIDAGYIIVIDEFQATVEELSFVGSKTVATLTCLQLGETE